MSKSKAQIIVTISVEPHTPASRTELQVAHAGADTAEILAALVVEKATELLKQRKVSAEPEPMAVRPHRKRKARGSNPLPGSISPTAHGS